MEFIENQRIEGSEGSERSEDESVSGNRSVVSPIFIIDGISYNIGKRIIDNEGYRGTIRYIGTVASAKNINDIWLGVEWDNPSRGKHDGSCIDSNNITHRYFQCINGAGSFIKSNKISLGVSFIDALKEKYVSLDAPEIAPDDILPDAYVATAKGVLKSIEFVGEKKIRQRQQIQDVKKIALRNMAVSTIGENITELAGHLVEVDLQDNLFSRWDEIIQLASNLPLLNNLLLHGNKIGNITNEFIEEFNLNSRTCFQSLLLLALNSCSITSWSSVINLETILPNIQELYLAVNQFEDISSFPSFNSSQFPHLHILDLSTCGITSWLSISSSLGSLLNLEELLLDGNPISDILPAQENQFNSLKRISLSGTRISTWNDVNILNSYRSLNHLRLTNIPLFHGKGPSEIRPEIIGRLQKLEIFNGSGISPKERNDSEKQFLRKIIKLKNNNYQENYQEFIQLFPNYQQLYEKYSNEINLADSQFNLSNNEVNNIAAELVEITFQNLIFSVGNNNFQPVQKKIPLNISVERIKLLTKQLFDIPPPIQVLSIRNTKNDMPVIMDDDKEILRYYGGINGAEIFINEKN